MELETWNHRPCSKFDLLAWTENLSFEGVRWGLWLGACWMILVAEIHSRIEEWMTPQRWWWFEIFFSGLFLALVNLYTIYINLLCVSYGMTSLHLQVIAEGFRHWKATMKGPSAEQAVEWRSHFCQKQCSELRGSGVGDDLQALARGVGPRFRSLPITLNL